MKFKDEVDLAERRDERLKTYMKELADDRKQAKPSQLAIGDDVLVKQDRTNKLSTPFDSSPYKIINKNGSMVTAERPDKRITRNTSWFKKVSKQCGRGYKKATQEPGSEIEESVEFEDVSQPDSSPNSEPNTPKTPVATRVSTNDHNHISDRPQRSNVAKRLPNKFDDFVTK